MIKIKILTGDTLRGVFWELMVEIESSSTFDHSNPDHTAWLERRIARRIGAGVQFFGLFGEDGAPIGLSGLLIADHPMFAGHSELTNLGVFASHRGQGHGSALLDHAEEVSREAGVYCMYITTYAADVDVIAYYGKRGFAPVATLPDLNGPGDEGQIYMRKILDRAAKPRSMV